MDMGAVIFRTTH